MMNLIFVAVGGAVGSVLRFLVSQWSVRSFGPAFPWGTLAVNIVGCFLIGVFSEAILRRFAGSVELRLLLVTGLLGGFTTFSSFSLEAMALFESGRAAVAFAYVAASVLLSLAAAALGLALTRALL